MAKSKSAGKKSAPKSGGSRRKAAKPTKGEAVDVSVGSLLTGDNMPPLRDITYHFETILGLMDKARTAAGKVGDAKKKAKEAGVDVPALMQVQKMMRLDPLDLAALLKQQSALMTKLGLPVQLALFEPKYGSVDEQAAAEGWAAGNAGRSLDAARWLEGTPGHEAYTRSWNDAQRDNVMGDKANKGDDDE